eukprot:6484671-Amphidinium_carterae.1
MSARPSHARDCKISASSLSKANHTHNSLSNSLSIRLGPVAELHELHAQDFSNALRRLSHAGSHGQHWWQEYYDLDKPQQAHQATALPRQHVGFLIGDMNVSSELGEQVLARTA